MEVMIMSLNQKLKNVYFTSLGCSKNLVDSQVMLGTLVDKGYVITAEPEKAEVIIVNTCAFIEASKVESIETLLDLSDYKQPGQGKCEALVMAGCLAQRYYSDLEKEMPEIDLFIGTGEYYRIAQLLEAKWEGSLKQKSFVEIPKYIHTELDPRLNTSQPHMAWLKISEGCNRMCTFCIIPYLRGNLRSRSIDSLVQEARKLADQGVKELNLISQDLSSYGVDFDPQNQKKIGGGGAHVAQLLRELEKVEGIEWIRLFYYYPDDLTEEVMELMSHSKKICRYLDMPIQHFSTGVLKRMNRSVTTEELYSKIKRLREHVPGIVLRTSVIVGFPGETEDDFALLKKGIKDLEFDHLGVFKYSDEEGTPAFKLKPKVSADVIDQRFEEIYQLQKKVLSKKNKQYLGQKIKVLVEGNHVESDMLLQGRHHGQAPEIDGSVIINDGLAKAGEFVTVEISEVFEYDLVGKIIAP